MDTKAITIGTIFFLLGLLALAFSARMVSGGQTFQRNGITAPAEVTATGRLRARDVMDVRFKTAAGEVIQIEKIPAQVKRSVGDIVTLIYPPENPKQAILHAPVSFWIAPIIIAILGLSGVLLGGGLVCQTVLRSSG